MATCSKQGPRRGGNAGRPTAKAGPHSMRPVTTHEGLLPHRARNILRGIRGADRSMDRRYLVGNPGCVDSFICLKDFRLKP